MLIVNNILREKYGIHGLEKISLPVLFEIIESIPSIEEIEHTTFFQELIKEIKDNKIPPPKKYSLFYPPFNLKVLAIFLAKECHLNVHLWSSLTSHIPSTIQSAKQGSYVKPGKIVGSLSKNLIDHGKYINEQYSYDLPSNTYSALVNQTQDFFSQYYSLTYDHSINCVGAVTGPPCGSCNEISGVSTLSSGRSASLISIPNSGHILASGSIKEKTVTDITVCERCDINEEESETSTTNAQRHAAVSMEIDIKNATQLLPVYCNSLHEIANTKTHHITVTCARSENQTFRDVSRYTFNRADSSMTLETSYISSYTYYDTSSGVYEHSTHVDLHGQQRIIVGAFDTITIQKPIYDACGYLTKNDTIYYDPSVFYTRISEYSAPNYGSTFYAAPLSSYNNTLKSVVSKFNFYYSLNQNLSTSYSSQYTGHFSRNSNDNQIANTCQNSTSVPNSTTSFVLKTHLLRITNTPPTYFTQQSFTHDIPLYLLNNNQQLIIFKPIISEVHNVTYIGTETAQYQTTTQRDYQSERYEYGQTTYGTFACSSSFSSQAHATFAGNPTTYTTTYYIVTLKNHTISYESRSNFSMPYVFSINGTSIYESSSYRIFNQNLRQKDTHRVDSYFGSSYVDSLKHYWCLGDDVGCDDPNSFAAQYRYYTRRTSHLDSSIHFQNHEQKRILATIKNQLVGPCTFYYKNTPIYNHINQDLFKHIIDQKTAHFGPCFLYDIANQSPTYIYHHLRQSVLCDSFSNSFITSSNIPKVRDACSSSYHPLLRFVGFPALAAFTDSQLSNLVRAIAHATHFVWTSHIMPLFSHYTVYQKRETPQTLNELSAFTVQNFFSPLYFTNEERISDKAGIRYGYITEHHKIYYAAIVSNIRKYIKRQLNRVVAQTTDTHISYNVSTENAAGVFLKLSDLIQITNTTSASTKKSRTRYSSNPTTTTTYSETITYIIRHT